MKKTILAAFFAIVATGLFLAFPGGNALAQDAADIKAAGSPSVLFTGVRVFNGVIGALSPSSNVLVIGNKIAKISTAAIPVAGETLVINGNGRTLMPGLIDDHVHIFMSASTREELNDPKADIGTLNAKATEEAKQILLRGFTSVRDVGGPAFELKRTIDQGKTPGPRIYPSGATISQTSGHGDSRMPNERSRRFGGTTSAAELMGIGFIADGRDEVLTATGENLRFGASQIKLMAGGGAATLYDPLDVTQYTLDEMRAAVEAADDWGTYVTVHAYTPKSVRRAVEAGVKCIEHGQLMDEATVKLLAQKGIWLSLQALDEAPATAPAEVIVKKRLVVEGADNAFKWAKKYKVKLAWGTDFLFSPPQNKNQNSDILKLLT